MTDDDIGGMRQPHGEIRKALAGVEAARTPNEMFNAELAFQKIKLPMLRELLADRDRLAAALADREAK
jgi:hypothetical protein